MKIQILNVTVTTTPTKTGSYQMADVAYKNLSFQGKIEGKKIASFGAQKASFEVVVTSQPGDIFDVSVVKNDKNYNDWVSMTKGNADSGAPQQSTAGQSLAGNATAARTSTYETPEERAKKQVYIIRQSSIGSAISALACGAKSPPKVGEVLEYAKQLEAYVFGTGSVGAAEKFPDVPDFPVDVE